MRAAAAEAAVPIRDVVGRSPGLNLEDVYYFYHIKICKVIECDADTPLISQKVIGDGGAAA